jgi:small conductance mechanosensitive channel
VGIFSEGLQDLLARSLLFLPKLLVSLVVFVLTLAAAAFLTRLVRSAMEKRDVSPELTLLLQKITRWTTIILGSIIALQQVNFDVTAFLAGLGFLGFTLGFAIQDVSKNFVAGLLLLLQQPFNIGDAIRVGDLSGNVVTIDLRATELRTATGKRMLIPNADVFASTIVNYGSVSRRLVELSAGVSYDSDLEFVRQTALKAIGAIAGVHREPAPSVFFNNLGPFTVDFTVYYWVDRTKISVPKAQDAGVSAIKTAFEEANIDMPFPTQVVHVRQQM